MNNCTRPRVNIAQSSNYIIAPVSVCNQDNGIENEAIGNNTPNPFPLYSLGNLRLGGAGGSACLDSRIPRHLDRRRALTYSRGCDAIVGDVELLGGKLCNRRNKHESDQSRFMGRSGAGEEGQRVGRWPGREVERQRSGEVVRVRDQMIVSRYVVQWPICTISSGHCLDYVRLIRDQDIFQR